VPLPPQIISNTQLGKGRKPGDTALFNYRHMLTDMQNQELEDMIANGTIRREEEEFYAQQIRERDRGLFRKNDQDKADEEGLSLEAYRKKYGIVAEPEPPTPEPPTPTPVTPTTPVNNAREPTYEELKIMYPDNYQRIVSAQTRGGNQADDASIEESLRITYGNYPRPLPTTTTPTTPVTPTTPTQPDREPTYEELQVMYPGSYRQYTRSYANEDRYTDTPTPPERQAEMMEALLRAEHTNRTQAGTAAPLPAQTPTPTPAPTTTTPSGAGPSDYRPRQAEPMQTAQTPEPTNP
jgi:hypothetical protein